ncbi:hypothetical protein G7Z17_g8747 [Cylindrodendrum hubeiense]|uniref:Uncharacterized protein n=1 Tax=Cylindrodendrum hubeiense TaxID=595255 RepID=A0A9P5L693_9HYPO|nr:hypothetical protein G7Z17_g8747 [Cylindrodendrum hubeiense]
MDPPYQYPGCEMCGGPLGDRIVYCMKCVDRICSDPAPSSVPPTSAHASSSGVYNAYQTGFGSDSGSGSAYAPTAPQATGSRSASSAYRPGTEPIPHPPPPQRAASSGFSTCTICNAPLEYDTYNYCGTCAQLLSDTSDSSSLPHTTDQSSSSGAHSPYQTGSESDPSYMSSWTPSTPGGSSSSRAYNPYSTGSDPGPSYMPTFPQRSTDSRSSGNAYMTDSELMPPPSLPLHVTRAMNRDPMPTLNSPSPFTNTARPPRVPLSPSQVRLTAEDLAKIARGRTPEDRANIEGAIRNLKVLESMYGKSDTRR